MNVKVAAVQMNSGVDKEANLKKAEKLIDKAAHLGAEVVGLPEMFNFLGPDRMKYDASEDLDGSTVKMLIRKAKEHGIYVHGGSMLERIKGSQKVHNTTVFINPRGEIIGIYRKMHLFDVEIPETKVQYRESAFVEPGRELTVVDVDGFKFGLTICYDLRFPELYRKLTLMGAQGIWVPASFTLYTGKDHWTTLLKARAIENQVYIIAPAQIGLEPVSGHVSYGRSAIVDPWGIVISQAPDVETVIIGELDTERIEEVRKKIPSLRHRRTDVYGSL